MIDVVVITMDVVDEGGRNVRRAEGRGLLILVLRVCVWTSDQGIHAGH